MIHPLDATPMQLREELAIVWALIEQEKEYSRELEQQLASRDADVVSLTNQRDYEYVRAENAEQERDELREQVKMLREVVNDALSGMGGGYAIWSPRAQEALAATEPKE